MSYNRNEIIETLAQWEAKNFPHLANNPEAHANLAPLREKLADLDIEIRVNRAITERLRRQSDQLSNEYRAQVALENWNWTPAAVFTPTPGAIV